MKLAVAGLLLTLPAVVPAQAPAAAGVDSPAAPAAAGFPVGVPLASGKQVWTPLTPAQKAKRRALRLVEPLTLAGAAAGAGIDQWRRVPHNWNEGGEGYAIRFASAEGYDAAHNATALVFDEALHLDPRYRPMPEAGFKKRVWNAVSQSLLAYKDDGGRTINMSEIGGNMAAGFIAGTWQPPGYRSADDAIERGALGLLFHTGKNVAREFLPGILHAVKH